MEELFQQENDVFERKIKKRKKSGFWRKLGIVIVGLGVVGAILLNTKLGRHVPGIKKGVIIYQSYDPNLIFDKVGSDHVNILLIGRDVNYHQVYDKHGNNINHKESGDRARSDSMIVISLNREGKVIRMVSLPRDAIVHMPPNEYKVTRAKLNAAHAYGGPELLRQTIAEELGITIHYHAVIKFEGFKNVIDKVGGVDIDVDGALKRRDGKLYRGDLDYDDNWGNLHIHIKKGPQHMDGQMAHNYVRFRMDLEGDPGRIRRQQQVMRALAKKLMHVNPVQAYNTVKELQQQFESDMDDEMISSAAAFAKSVGDAGKIQPITLFGAFSSKGSFKLNRPLNEAMLQFIFGSSFNPNTFLQRSPWTDEDEIGATNDMNPATQEVLRQAGLVKSESGGWRVLKMAGASARSSEKLDGGSSERLPIQTVPVESNPGSLSTQQETPEEPILVPTHASHDDVAAEATPDAATGESPRRTGRGKKKRHQPEELAVEESQAAPVISPATDQEAPVRHSD